MMNGDLIEAFNLLLQRLDELIAVLERIAVALEKTANP
jgi:hypothetical protein